MLLGNREVGFLRQFDCPLPHLTGHQELFNQITDSVLIDLPVSDLHSGDGS